MNIFEYAMQMEKDGEAYYRELAQQAANKGLKTILTMLADEEVKHYNTIEKMKTAEPHMAETTILTDAKNVFVQIQESGESFDFDLGQIELYKKAQDIEMVSSLLMATAATSLPSKQRYRQDGQIPIITEVEQYQPDYVEEITKIPRELLVQSARLYAKSKKAMIVYSMGITQHTTGVDNVKSLANLAVSFC